MKTGSAIWWMGEMIPDMNVCLWRHCRSHKLGFEKALKQKKNISQGFLFGEAPICCVNDSTSISPLQNENIPREGEVHEHTGWNSTYLGAFPNNVSLTCDTSPFPGRKRTILCSAKIANAPPTLQGLHSLPDWNECTVRPGWVFIAVLSLTSWNSALQTQAGSCKCNSSGRKEATHSTFRWRWTVQCVGIRHSTGPQNTNRCEKKGSAF